MTTEKQPLQYGMIGCGMMGQEHVRNLKLLDNVELTHAYEPDEGMRTQMKQRVSSIQFHDSIEALLKNTEVDAWVIARWSCTRMEEPGEIQFLRALGC